MMNLMYSRNVLALAMLRYVVRRRNTSSGYYSRSGGCVCSSLI